jgi:hypothetical protein
MSEIPSISGSAAGLSRITPRSTGQPPVAININPADNPGDSLEVSPIASLLAKLAELPDVRQDLVDRVKSQIASDTYLTDDKIDAAIENLAADL